tara:strand:- start:86 stop:295 length:210 start_codon:yes stop_codon:yes gene_type:complete
MRLNEIISSFTIYVNNEENGLLEAMPEGESFLSEYDERQQTVINNLIRKSLITKIDNNGTIAIKKNIQG